LKKYLRLAIYTLLALVLTTVVAVALIVRFALAPSAGEWSERVRILGPLEVELGMPTVLRLVTVSWFGPWLAGYSVDTRFGPVLLDWESASGSLQMNCSPCHWDQPALGDKPVQLKSLAITARRDVDLITGTLRATPAGSRASGGAADLRGRWTGRLSQKGLAMTFDLASAPIAQWYQVLAPTLPELQRARISGTATAQARLSLPEYSYGVTPRLTDFSVEGLDVQRLLQSRAAACAPATSLPEGSWVAKAAVGALDPEYHDHAGYRPASLAVASDAAASAPVADKPPKGKGKRPQPPKAAAPAATAEQEAPPTLDERVVRLLLTPLPRAGEQRLRELLYVAELEHTLGKTGVLDRYLEMAPWGSGLCGAEAAARHYFKRGANGLAPAQAVWLATLLDDPAGRVARWQADGRIDRERARQVVQGMQNINGGQRAALYSGLSGARFAAPAP